MRAQALGAVVVLVLLSSCSAGGQGNTDDVAGGDPSIGANAVKEQTDAAAADVLPPIVGALDAQVGRMEARFDSCSAGKRYQAVGQLRSPADAVEEDSGRSAVAELLTDAGWEVEDDGDGLVAQRGAVSVTLSGATERTTDQTWSVRTLSIEAPCRIYPDGDALEDVAATDYADLVKG